MKPAPGILLAVLLSLCAGALSAAPAPQTRTRMLAQLPNWTGQWEIVGYTPDASGGITESLDEVERQMRQWGPPPYKPDMQVVFDKAAAEARKVSRQIVGRTGPNEFRVCTFGFPRLMLASPLMFEALVTPEETALIFSGPETRHIYTDGRAHTAPDDIWPTTSGDSIGHWEGTTLVIDTIAVSSPPQFEGGVAITANGGPTNADFALIAFFSPAVHFVERIRMLDRDHLEDQMTIIDPLFFTAPWHISRQYHRVRHLNRMIHEECEGEDRNPLINGRFTLTPPPAPPPSR